MINYVIYKLLYYLRKNKNISTKYYISYQLANYCKIDPYKKYTIFEILNIIYLYLKQEYLYVHTYYGEDPQLNNLIQFRGESLSHHKLQLKILKHFRF